MQSLRNPRVTLRKSSSFHVIMTYYKQRSTAYHFVHVHGLPILVVWSVGLYMRHALYAGGLVNLCIEVELLWPKEKRQKRTSMHSCGGRSVTGEGCEGKSSLVRTGKLVPS